MESLNPDVELYYGERISNPEDGYDYFVLGKMKMSASGLLFPGIENKKVSLPLGPSRQREIGHKLIKVLNSADEQMLEVPLLNIQTIPDSDMGSGFDREYVHKTFTMYAQQNGIPNPVEFADEKLATLDDDTPEYDPKGLYL